MKSPGSPDNPLRVAIIGSGPSGCYAAGRLLKEKDVQVEVDMFDSLPTPWGLVRAGVAPDHPNIKSVTRVFEKTAASPSFRFLGNVEFGRDVSHDELRDHYHAIVYAVGAQTDRRMGIAGEELAGSWAATEFVAWYNGHPDFRELDFDLSHERAVIIGNGNVAMDCARMLALTYEELAKTDVADHALEVLRESRVRDIVICGRRGPAQAAFTNPELLELGELTAADVFVDPAEVVLDDASARSIEGEGDMTARKNVEILTDYSKREPTGKPKRVSLRFLVSPAELHGVERVEEIELTHNELVVDEGGAIRALPTDRRERMDCGLVLRSIGYKGVALPGVSFDDGKGTIPNEEGRILDVEGGGYVVGEYCVGWIKRGPTGVIGTNKKDGQESAEHLIADARDGKLLEPATPSREAIDALVAERKPDHVTYEGWQAIDRLECAKGEPDGRPRVKLCSREALVAAARGEHDDEPAAEPVGEQLAG
jgi:ferredoxin/flavodoxin---NADP+ reductase